jgi:hypothetical protein
MANYRVDLRPPPKRLKMEIASAVALGRLSLPHCSSLVCAHSHNRKDRPTTGYSLAFALHGKRYHLCRDSESFRAIFQSLYLGKNVQYHRRTADIAQLVKCICLIPREDGHGPTKISLFGRYSAPNAAALPVRPITGRYGGLYSCIFTPGPWVSMLLSPRHYLVIRLPA